MSQTTADILYQAAIQDLTGRFFDAFDKRIKAMNRQTKAASQSAQRQNQQLGKSIGMVAGLVSGLTSHFLALGTQAVGQLKNVVQSSIMLAARADTLAVAVAQIGHNAGYSTAELARFEEQIKGQGITTLKTRQIMIKLIGANIDLAKAADLARAAQNLAQITGQNSSETFGRLTHAILTLNTAILSDMNLNVNLQAAYKAAAGQLNVNADALDYNTKKQIALNEVLRAAQPMMGAYEAAMTTAGKQAGSMARYMEELQLAIGKAFQPAYSAWIQFQTRMLKEAHTWFVNNADAVAAFANTLGDLVTWILNVASAAIKLVGALSPVLRLLRGLPGVVREAGTALAGFIIGQEEAADRAENLGMIWKQTTSIIVGGVTFGLTAIKEMVGAIGDVIEIVRELQRQPLWKWGSEEFDTINKALDDMETRFANVGTVANEAANQAFTEWAQAKGILGEVAGEADTVADRMAEIAAETEDAIAKIKELNAAFAEEMADVLKRRMRQDIDAEIALARRREAMQRRALERLDQIYKNAAKRRARILEDAAKAEQEAIESVHQQRADRERAYRHTLIDIEINYRRTLQDIQAGYEYELTELVRRNDAVAILRLQRQTNERIRQARTGRDREKEDSARGYRRDMEELQTQLNRRRAELREDAQERLREFEENLQEQLTAYQESLDKERAELERSLAERKEDLERHREWEDEDRREAHREELRALGEHLAGMETLTDSGLRSLLARHGSAIRHLSDMWASYYSWKRQAAYAAYMAEPEPGTEYTRAEAEAESSSSYSYQRGGFGVMRRPTTIKVGERGPEAFAAIPLTGGTVRHSFSDVNVNLHGVTPQTEADLKPVVMEAFLEIVGAVRSQVAAGA
jgi:tetrahydromethanopterin S-methyltransferase subunit G